MARAGRKVPDEEIKKMLEEFHDKFSGKISFEDFKKMMTAEETYEMKFSEDKMAKSTSSLPSGGQSPVSPNRSKSPSTSDANGKRGSLSKKTFGDFLTVN
mmetsp:Transcript_20218/g.17417  ORF Transcript_20218/g.17417 Transcript_20218/m.17417 type:complete len:100 (+) Transcript_20218:1345-1644(+)